MLRQSVGTTPAEGTAGSNPALVPANQCGVEEEIMSARLSVVPSAPNDWDETEEVTRVVSAAEARTKQDSGVWSLPELVAEAERPVLDQAVVYSTYSPLVRRIALKAVRSLPRSITLDDIVSAGWVGMSEALRRRPAAMPEEQFEAYSSYRIRGAILDYLRALDPLSRRLRSASRDINAATRDLSHRLGRAPQQDELARHLGISLSQLQKSVADIQEAGMDKLDVTSGFEAPSAEPSPEAAAAKNQMVKTILAAMQHLPERLQIVLALHYQHECSLREIGEILKVTESRVCQLHAEAVQRIRAHLDGRPASSGRRTRRRVAVV